MTASSASKQIQHQVRLAQAGASTGAKQGGVNANPKQAASVSTFMPQGKVLPLQGGRENHHKVQMLKTTISQTSQSRDASLTSHKTGNGQGAPAATNSQGKSNKISMKQVNMSLFPAGHKQ